MDDWPNYFATDYSHARAKFREAAEMAGAQMVKHKNPTMGLNGEDLTTDVAFIGDP